MRLWKLPTAIGTDSAQGFVASSKTILLGILLGILQFHVIHGVAGLSGLLVHGTVSQMLLVAFHKHTNKTLDVVVCSKVPP